MTSYQGSMQAEDQIFFYWLMSKSCHNQKSTHWQQMHCNKHAILSLTCAYCCISVTCRDLSWKQNKCVKIRLACFLKVSSLPQPHPTPLKKCLWILDFFSSKTCLAHTSESDPCTCEATKAVAKKVWILLMPQEVFWVFFASSALFASHQ